MLGLTTTAALEYDISKGVTSASRSNEAVIPSKRIAEVAHELRSVEHDSEDELQGRAALLWAEWTNLELSKTPVTDSAISIDTSGTSKKVTPWTSTCIVKAAYTKGALLGSKQEHARALASYRSVVPWLDGIASMIPSNPQLSFWIEQLLSTLAISQSESPGDEDSALTTFRQWALAISKTKPASPRLYGFYGSYHTRRVVWKAYYLLLSRLLREGFSSQTSRSAQSSELRRVQTGYENELLRTTQFPTASQSNTIVEEWVEQVIGNWEIMCGTQWHESELGEGGRNSAGRSVLDIIYRAATKTFHSTLILRRLFQLHKSLADFDLAYKALDTYLELTKRARLRAAKAGTPSSGQDSDDLVLRTMAEGIEGLCSFGHEAEAERAYDLCLELETLHEEVQQNMQPRSLTNGDTVVTPTNESATSVETTAIVYRALGIGKAHWALWTPFSERRTPLQAEAVTHLRSAVEMDVTGEQKVYSSYALGLLLAQTRDVDTAIECAKTVLGSDAGEARDLSSESRALPVWHLLALLLTARQDFDTASQACYAALEQFPSPKTLFGDSFATQAPSEKQQALSQMGLVDDMECAELQRIIEIRLTELALTDLTEGPEQAVNSSNDLLMLYSRLFKRFGVATEEKTTHQTKFVEPPKSSAGTVKSFRGSIFRRKKLTSTSEVFYEKANGTPSVTTNASRPTTQATTAPTIQVTDEDGKSPHHKHRLFRSSHDSSRQEKRQSSQTHRSPSKLVRHRHSREIQTSQPQPPPSISSDRQSFETTQENVPTSSTDRTDTTQPRLATIQSTNEIPTNTSPSSHNQTPVAKQPLPEMTQNLLSNSTAPPPLHHPSQPPSQDTRLPGLPHPSPPTYFPRPTQQIHALTILTKIWLTIASLYRRASMFEDSREATDEAAKTSLRIESLVASVESSARAFANPGWGGAGKSSDEVWADVYCERAELAMGVARAKGLKEREEDVLDNGVDNEGVREAVELWEQALMYFPDHAGSVVGLSNVLLDYYERKVELARRVDDGLKKELRGREEGGRKRKGSHGGSDHVLSESSTSNGTVERSRLGSTPEALTEEDLKKTPENLNRLAARDRAYGLLSTLTKLGSGWDDADAWYALARAHELGGELEKAKEILWWVVELEDSRPIRAWRNLGCTGYVL